MFYTIMLYYTIYTLENSILYYTILHNTLFCTLLYTQLSTAAEAAIEGKQWRAPVITVITQHWAEHITDGSRQGPRTNCTHMGNIFMDIQTNGDYFYLKF